MTTTTEALYRYLSPAEAADLRDAADKIREQAEGDGDYQFAQALDDAADDGRLRNDLIEQARAAGVVFDFEPDFDGTPEYGG